MKKRLVYAAALLMLACAEDKMPSEWALEESLVLEKVNPIGIAANEEGIWLSDGDRNRLVLLDTRGRVIRALDSLDRPMHIAAQGKELLVPTYGNDQIARFQDGEAGQLLLEDSLDAPAGVDVSGEEIAIADFYNHRILYSADGERFISFGTEGKAAGEFYYPTDVQILSDEIWVADAYNNRVQVFDKRGNHLRILGDTLGINAATGIFVSEEELFVTDFESDRVLVLDQEGNLRQVLEENIDKPTDVLLKEDVLYVINYKSGRLNTYRKSALNRD